MDILVLGIAILGVVLLLLALFCYGVWRNSQKNSLCIYSQEPLRTGADVHWMTAEKCLRFLYEMQNFDNQIFDLQTAAFSRATGRLFPNCLTWHGTYRVDWHFLQNRYPGHYVSWGSLSDEQKRVIYSRHSSLEGFQTEHSSSQPSPRAVDPEFAYTKPGPLYVDLDTSVLLGWKIVPETDLEVLVVQKPLKVYDRPQTVKIDDE